MGDTFQPLNSPSPPLSCVLVCPSGLASYLYTSNMARGWRVMEALEYGMVGWNEAAISTEVKV